MGASKYRLLLQAQLDAKSLDAQIKAITSKQVNLRVGVSTNNISQVKQLGTAWDKVRDTINKGLISQMRYVAASALIVGSLREIGRGVEHIKALNKEMTDIQIVTGMSNSEIKDLTFSYNQLAQEMGATTIEVAQGTLEWFRQGKTAQEAVQLVRGSLMLSKLANMESAQATEYLTAIMNGFKLEASSVVGVIDKLVAVDNAAATSAAEIALALTRSSNSAQEAGVSFEALVSYIATVSSVTRKSASSIGESFKTMFARLTNVKLTALDDADSAINDVEKALGLVGIKVRDGLTSFRSMEDVLGELAARWASLNEVQKSAVSNAIAGVRQRENFIVLMNNFNEALRLQREEWISTGLSANRYQIYLNNLEAGSNQLTASWEGMWQATISNGALKFFMDLAGAVMKLVAASGGLVPVLAQVVALFTLLYREQIASFFLGIGASVSHLSKSIFSLVESLFTQVGVTTAATAAQTGYTTATTAATVATMTFKSALGLLAILASAVVLIYQGISVATKSLKERTQELNVEIEKTSSRMAAIKDQIGALSGLGDEYTKLATSASRTAEEQADWLRINNAIHNLLPQLAGEYDNMGNFILANIPPTEELIALKEKEYQAELAILQLKIVDGIKDRSSAYADYVETLSAAQQELVNLQNEQAEISAYKEGEGGIFGVSQADLEEWASTQDSAYLKIAEANADVADAVAQMREEYALLTDDQKARYISLLAEEADITEKLAREILTYAGSLKSVTQETEQAYYASADLASALKETGDTLDSINNVIAKQQAGKLLYEDIVALLEVHGELIDAIDILDGQLVVNEAAMNEYSLELIDQAIAEAEAANAGEEYLAVLRAYREELDRAVPLTRDYVTELQNLAQETYMQLQYMAPPGTTTQNAREFEQLGAVLTQNAQNFKENRISAEEYFQTLKSNLEGANLQSIFGENASAAQVFFTGLVQNSAAALNQLNSEFNAGNLSVSEYTDTLDDLGDVFLGVGEFFTDILGGIEGTRSQVDGLGESLSGAMENVATGIDNIRQAQELIALTESGWTQVVADGLQYGTDAYNEYMQQIANAYVNSGIMFTDVNGIAYDSAASLYGYLTTSEGNFGLFADSVANQAGGSIQGIITFIGAMLEALGSAISNFDATISFKPSQTGVVPFKIPILGQEIKIPIPEFEVAVAGKGDSLANIGNSIKTLGTELKGTKLNWDRKAFEMPTRLNQATGGMGKAANRASKAFKELGGSVGGVGGSADEAKKSVQDLLDLVLAKIKQEKEAEKERLKEELDGYKKIIDRRKDLLRSKREEEKYNQDIQKQSKAISDMESELIELSLDDSEEAMARRMKIEEELAKAKEDLANEQADHSVDVQEAALDKDYARFEEYIDAKIKGIDDFLSRPGEMMQEAIRIIEEKGATLYDDLMEWNKIYGSGIDAEVTSAWNDAYEAMSQFKDELGKWDVQFTMHWEQDSSGYAEYHSGGFVGGIESNEEFAKLLKGEVVLTPEQMDGLISQFIPLPAQTKSAAGMGGANMENFIGSIVVQGNLDTKVLPEMERVIQKAFDEFNKAMTTRGYQRRVADFA